MTKATSKKRGRPPKGAKKVVEAATVPGATLIKKYGNRRLYDTKRSRYVTLEDLVEVIAKGEEIQVIDATTGDDVTKRVMTQIILQEEESRHLNLLPLNFLKKLIQYRDESMREYFQKYLSMSLDVYLQAQKSMEQRMQGFGGGFDPSMFSTMFPWMPAPPAQPVPPVPPPAAPQQPRPPPAPEPRGKKQEEGVVDELAELRRRLAELETRYRK